MTLAIKVSAVREIDFFEMRSSFALNEKIHYIFQHDDNHHLGTKWLSINEDRISMWIIVPYKIH